MQDFSISDAAAADDAVALRRMASGGDPNARDSDGVPALHLVAKGGHVEAVEALSQGGAYVDVDGSAPSTALHLAAANGRLGVVRRLLDAGANMELKDAQSNTPLMLAAEAKRWGIVRLLVENGADPNGILSGSKRVLTTAAEEGETESVAVMLRTKKPCDVSIALSYAKNASVVCAFEDALPGIVREEGDNALRAAASDGRLEPVVALLEAGAAIDAQDVVNWTALMYASCNGHVECVKELVRRGAHTDAVDEWEFTALHWASSNGKEEVVRLLLDAGADATVRDNSGRTALDVAESESVKNIFKTIQIS